MSSGPANHRGTGAVLLTLSALTCVVMLAYLAGMFLGSPNGSTTVSFWFFTGATIVFALVGGRLMR